MRKYLLQLCFLLIPLAVYSQEGKTEFLSQLRTTISNDKKCNTPEACETLLRKTLHRRKLPFEEGNYTFIPVFEVVCRKTSKEEKQNFNKEHFLTYLNTKKCFLNEMYVFKDSIFYGYLGEKSARNGEFYFEKRGSNINNEILAEKLRQRKASLVFCPSCLGYRFVIEGDKIEEYNYDSVGKTVEITDLESLMHSERFDISVLFLNATDREVIVIGY